MSSCRSTGRGVGESTSVSIGIGVGGLLLGHEFTKDGSRKQIYATVAGVILGAFIGSRIGKYMNERDKMNVQKGIETGYNKWSSNNNNIDEITVTAEKIEPNHFSMNNECRTFETVAIINEKKETITGKACKRQDGKWETF